MTDGENIDILDVKARKRCEAKKWKYVCKAIEEVGFWVCFSAIMIALLKNCAP